jgi:hypothetical protein
MSGRIWRKNFLVGKQVGWLVVWYRNRLAHNVMYEKVTMWRKRFACRLVGLLASWPVGQPVWLVCRLVVGLLVVGLSVDRLIGCSFGWLVLWLACCMFVWPEWRLTGWFIGLFIGWLIGWLVFMFGWLVACQCFL